MKSILDPTFRYVPSASTDLRKTFARLRREQRAAAQQAEADKVEAEIKVAPIVRRRGQR